MNSSYSIKFDLTKNELLRYASATGELKLLQQLISKNSNSINFNTLFILAAEPKNYDYFESTPVNECDMWCNYDLNFQKKKYQLINYLLDNYQHRITNKAISHAFEVSIFYSKTHIFYSILNKVGNKISSKSIKEVVAFLSKEYPKRKKEFLFLLNRYDNILHYDFLVNILKRARYFQTRNEKLEALLKPIVSKKLIYKKIALSDSNCRKTPESKL